MSDQHELLLWKERATQLGLELRRTREFVLLLIANWPGDRLHMLDETYWSGASAAEPVEFLGDAKPEISEVKQDLQHLWDRLGE